MNAITPGRLRTLRWLFYLGAGEGACLRPADYPLVRQALWDLAAAGLLHLGTVPGTVRVQPGAYAPLEDALANPEVCPACLDRHQPAV